MGIDLASKRSCPDELISCSSSYSWYDARGLQIQLGRDASLRVTGLVSSCFPVSNGQSQGPDALRGLLSNHSIERWGLYSSGVWSVEPQ
jgi:hypothetical protein